MWVGASLRPDLDISVVYSERDLAWHACIDSGQKYVIDRAVLKLSVFDTI